MSLRVRRILLPALLIFAGLFFTRAFSVQADISAQIPTVNVPTVTGTPFGAYITVRPQGEVDQINLRAGPSAVDYEIVGVLVVGQQAPAIGRTAAGEWIEIAYPSIPGGVAWVYSPLVDLTGEPPIVEPPATPTPRVTATIDPTLAAQFLVDVPPTRLPTFTPPPPVIVPTFPPAAASSTASRVPMGLVIIGMAVIGLFGTFISFLRGR